MDIEYHYNMTYLIALKAGYDDDAAYIIAYSSQHVDDNTKKHEINKYGRNPYRNYISQTSNILRPREQLLRIYSHFHFIPGKPGIKSAQRRDGKTHLLNTTPDSPNARDILRGALKTGDLYQIGIASHAFSDSWAHQNFVGYKDGFNSMEGVLGRLAPNIGHADAGHSPDQVALVWKDDRLLHQEYRRISNTDRFLKAAGRLFEEYRRQLKPRGSEDLLKRDRAELRRDLKAAMESGEDKRFERYKDLSLKYGRGRMPDYRKKAWFDEAVKIGTRGGGKARRTFVAWKSPRQYKRKDWYKFQEAVKAYQEIARNVLAPLFSRLDLERL